MDSPTRSFFALVGVSATLAAYAACGLIAYVLIPLLGLSQGALVRLGPACLFPALALIALVATSVGSAARTLGRQLSASRRLAHRVQALALRPPPELLAAARASGLEDRLALVDSGEWVSFAYGVLVPRVAVGRDFVERLTAGELRAVLEHERYHVRHLDPLRALLSKTLTEAFFFLPSLEDLRLRYEVGRELEADRRAERAWGRRPLLGALSKALAEPGRDSPAASLADPGFLEARISRLETGQAPALGSVGVSSLLTSALGVGSWLLLFAAAVAGLGGSSALVDLAVTELSPGGALLGIVCVAPLVAVLVPIHRLLSRRAGEPLAPG
jgi:Zn-dependent protease with chaperone function